MKQCPICVTNYPDERTTCPTDGATLLVTSDWSPGTLIKGKYRIIARLGRGGMGTVYKAEHIALEEVRALKVMTRTGDAEFVRRFRQEAQAARRLRHANVVHVDDLDQADDGSFFIAMDYVDGVSLRQLLQATQGPLPLLRTFGIVRGVAEALAAAHALGMVHRDIKPENILLARDPQGRDLPKILDFGIVAMKESSSTQSTRYLLTPAQGSPEQWKGMKSSELDGRTDLYALGVVWYEMLTGRLPLHAHTNEGWMRAHLVEIPEPPSRHNPELAPYPNLNALVLRLLAKDRSQRPQDAQAFLGELNLIEAQLPWNVTSGATPRVHSDATSMFLAHFGKRRLQGSTGSSVFGSPPSSANTNSRILVPRVLFTLVLIAGVIGLLAFGAVYGSQSVYFSRLVVATRDIAAAKVNQRACDRGDAQACTKLGFYYERGRGLPKNENRGLQLYQKGCDMGDALGCTDLGDAYAEGREGIATDESRAAQLYRKACDSGDQSGCFHLSFSYAHGQGVAKDDNAAVQLAQRGEQLRQDGCDSGDAADCTSLGFDYQYAFGLGVTKSSDRAAHLYQRGVKLLETGCDGDQSNRCVALAAAYQFGDFGLKKDRNHSVTAFQKACDLGAMNGCFLLAEMYLHEEGPFKDQHRAVQLFREACNGGAESGCYELGQMYLQGSGLPKNVSRAKQFFRLACDLGLPGSCGTPAK